MEKESNPVSETNTPDTRGLHPDMVAQKWKPGYCPNPKGRPKGSRNRSTIVREALEAKIRGEDGKEIEVVDAMTIAIVAKAMQGDVPAFKELLDSGYGKLTDKQELTGLNGEPVTAIIRTVVDPKAE